MMKMMMTKIGKEMTNNTKNKTKDKKNRNTTTMRKGNNEILINQLKIRDKEEAEIGIRKDKDSKNKKGIQKNPEKKQVKNLKTSKVTNKTTISPPQGKCKDGNK